MKQLYFGQELGTSQYRVFFGKRGSSFDWLMSTYPQFQFAKLKQVHGNAFVNGSASETAIADGHFTDKRRLALSIVTADCAPFFIFSEQARIVAALHLGWRGVAKNLLNKAIADLQKKGCDPDQLRFFLGPHIQKESFEVSNEVRDEILSSLQVPQKNFYEPVSDAKSRLDLKSCICQQAIESGARMENISIHSVDTFGSADYCSYRRASQQQGNADYDPASRQERQLSFIALL